MLPVQAEMYKTSFPEVSFYLLFIGMQAYLILVNYSAWAFECWLMTNSHDFESVKHFKRAGVGQWTLGIEAL